MTIRFLTSWNGYQPGDVATLTNEAALIAGGIARPPLVDGPFYGSDHIGTFAWEQLPTPSAYLAGKHAWCANYPSVGGYGAEVVCTGSRWKSISQQHCLLSPPSAVAGTLFAAASAAALYGSTVLIPGGVLQTDDNIRLIFAAQHPTIGSTGRRVDINFATTAAGVEAGSKALGFSHANASTKNINVEKMATLTGPTNSRGNNVGLAGVGTTSNLAQADLTIPTIAENVYAGVVVTPSADTSWLMFSASVYVEFAR